ncbi:preprotein translocase subunit SecA [Candidatus Acetothermia bacterium]|nr:preprotein translocase subunit SecA [Candidatus Acetothermia bacterium]
MVKQGFFRNKIDYLFGQTNEQRLKRLQRYLVATNSFQDQMRSLSDGQLASKTDVFRDRLNEGESIDDILPEAFAVVREAAARTVNMRPFDVQILGAVVLHQRRIAEMMTGEGKTLVATLPAYLNALTGKVHIITVNDYLASRDREWMGPIYEFLGLTVGLIQETTEPEQRKAAYAADITYGTNSQFGFDYLRDNMVIAPEQKVQQRLDFAIIDEIDNILIDEARTPLIISGSTAEKITLYRKFAKLAPQFKPGIDVKIDEEAHRLTLTDVGIHKAEDFLRIENIYSPEYTDILHHLENALRARYMYTKEHDYIVKDGRVIIVDEFTGRLMPDRRYSDGLHQALEAKEGLMVQRESQTLAQITLQHYFGLYRGICGMTGTAKTEEDEFKQIYGLDVVVIPTNAPLVRTSMPDVIYRTEKGKLTAIADTVKRLHQTGRPALIGTNSIDKSERLSQLFKLHKLEHNVLNAKHHEREAAIIKDAGQRGAITIATNMAGRGTDIKLGPGVAEIGGLHVIGCQRHESRRIDNQLLGRAGRQGDPGSSQFFLSLEDDLLRIFGGDMIGSLMDRIGMEEGEPIEHAMLTTAIQRAQKRVEGRNFEIRKRLLEYDLVLAKQREAIYSLRNRFLIPTTTNGAALNTTDLDQYLVDLIDDYSEQLVATHFDRSLLPEEWNLDSLVNEFRHFVTVDRATLEGKDYDELVVTIQSLLVAALNKQRERLGNQFPLISRFLILKIIDDGWLSHLYTLDDLRGGIGLTAYGGTDPQVEFKRESFRLFQQMLNDSQVKIIRYLLAARVDKNTAQQAVLAGSGARAISGYHGGETAGADRHSLFPAAPVRVQKRPGRNDPCPCGSGKKYKRCCGQ